jgi:hypothetical protein
MSNLKFARIQLGKNKRYYAVHFVDPWLGEVFCTQDQVFPARGFANGIVQFVDELTIPGRQRRQLIELAKQAVSENY